MAKKPLKLVVWMEKVGIKDVGQVGGKNASLGEMIAKLSKKGVRVPSGFIVTADAYRLFLKETGLREFIKKTLKGLDTSNMKDLSARGKLIRETIKKATFPKSLERSIIAGYAQMEKRYGKNIDVAVRSSATAEDLPGASFAGEHETYLGIRGAASVSRATKSAMASLFTDRAISYRVDKGFDHFKVALSVGVQKMVRSDSGVSGVMFTVDTESGFRNTILIDGSLGLGEMIVQGKVTPDEFLVFKPALTAKGTHDALIDRKLGTKQIKMIYSQDAEGVKATKIIRTTDKERDTFCITNAEVLELARWGMLIEDHYSEVNKHWTPMDMEWAKDGKDGKLYIVQARPETVQAGRDFTKVKEYRLKGTAPLLTKGTSVGTHVACGKARVILDVKHIGEFQKGEVLVTDMTDPDWEPIMKIASAIVTDKGGRTSHAAIVSRELGIPAIVGSETATRKIRTGQMVTVDTIGVEGFVYDGEVPFDTVEHDVKKIPEPKTHIMMNIATPDTAFEKSFLPSAGVGLAREEFIIASNIGVHPMALLEYKKLPPKIKSMVDIKTRGWASKTAFYVDNLSYGIAKIAAAFYPKPVIVRFSDFKTNEYRTLLGGDAYEPKEENPMIGWRGASRYYDPKFRRAFELECEAIKKVRESMSLTNVIPMIPFCRTPEEAKKVLAVMEKCGLKRGENGLKVYIMCEIPSNVLLAEKFLELSDGYSIGSNDLTQCTMGLDRDSGLVTPIANERNEAVKILIRDVIKRTKAMGKYIGICGQGPSDYEDFATFLVEAGIDSMSLNPDTVVKTTVAIAKKEKELGIQ